MALEPSLVSRAAVHAALGDTHRLAIVDALDLCDRAPSELAEMIGIESNLLAHHLDTLERVGLIERLRSSGDGRRRYLRLRREPLDDLVPAPRIEARSVLFLCTANSARSQLAAAVWNQASPGTASSAGTHPAERVHPRAIEAAERHGLDLSGARPRRIERIERAVDERALVVTVCDRAHEELGERLPQHLHWSIPDPVATGTRRAFDDALVTLRERIEVLRPRMAAV